MTYVASFFIHSRFDLVFLHGQELKTNAFRRNGNANEKFDRRAYDDEPRVFCRGDYMGGFAQGSTIVLLFTAPSSFEFVPKPGKHVKVGESLGRVENKAG